MAAFPELLARLEVILGCQLRLFRLYTVQRDPLLDTLPPDRGRCTAGISQGNTRQCIQKG
jgi:hypothetical protein